MGGVARREDLAGRSVAETARLPPRAMGGSAERLLRRRFRPHVAAPGRWNRAAGHVPVGLCLARKAPRRAHHRPARAHGLEITATKSPWRASNRLRACHEFRFNRRRPLPLVAAPFGGWGGIIETQGLGAVFKPYA